MFSERLENLIKACLQDGFLTEQEKQAILKRAESEGEDPEEVDIYIQSLMQKAQQSLKQKEDELDERITNERKQALGRVCPQCGRPVPPLTLKCECGFEFPLSNSRESSVQELAEKIEKIQSDPYKVMDPKKEGYASERMDRENELISLISVFAVPNTKEDIIDFLTLSSSNAKKKGGFILGTRLGRLLLLLLILGLLIGITIYLIVNVVYDELSQILIGMGVVLLVMLVFGSSTVTNFFFKDDNILRWNRRAGVWKSKIDQVIMKARTLRGDPEFQRQVDYFEGLVYKKKEIK